MRFRLSRLDVSLWRGDTCILGDLSAGPADLQKVINVGLCADQITFVAKNRLNTNSGAVI